MISLLCELSRLLFPNKKKSRGVGWGGDGREVQTGGDICIPDFPCGSDGKASAYNAGDLGSIPGSGRSSREGNGNPLQYSCLENPMDGGAW